MIRRPPRSTLSSSSAASDVYKRQKLYLNGVANWACKSFPESTVFGTVSQLLERLTDSPITTVQQPEYKVHVYAQRSTVTRWRAQSSACEQSLTSVLPSLLPSWTELHRSPS
eukprot:TRINITY_DN11384_c0_g1_i14.p1 TRINITY_DN11384_c0_g1~~TRINITY_DN11384_c0_g1_i14.p1  ORF type:complete len:112 (-),score=3.66 TRINITY_DN11384_c0_g1_i14:539-874(-)